MTVKSKLSQFSLMEEIRCAYKDLEIITSRIEYRDKEKQIIEMEMQLTKTQKETPL